MKHSKRLIYIIIGSVMSLFFIIYMTPNNIQVLVSDTYFVKTTGCKMPKWDPFHESLKPLYKKVSVPYSCDLKPSFLVALSNSTVLVNLTALSSRYNLDEKSLRCTYKEIKRDPGKIDRPTDDKISFTKERTLVFGEPLTAEFLYVQCFDQDRMFHDEFLALTPLKVNLEKQVQIRDNSGIAYEKLNVIILGIDSISKLNFLRHFKKTYTFLTEKMNAFQMHGYNKVDDNTFPNLVPLLTGHFYTDFWNDTLSDMFFDDIDFIWKYFKLAGYNTLFAEDAPTIATFNYLRNGFKEPPADYYFRPFALAVDQSSVPGRSKKFCFDSRMEMRVLFDYTRSFVDTMADRPMFAFTFTAGTTHDELNNAAYAEDPTYDLLFHLHSTNVTNNSLVILMSDHGLRFGPILETYIGKFEERWPILFMSFPEWFLKKHPQLALNLETNQHRLTTPFDIHATLLHLVGMITKNSSVSSFISSLKSVTLFQEVPETRTCEEAGIQPHWCTCDVQKSISADDPLARAAADVINSTLSDILRPHYNECVQLRPMKVLEARNRRPTDDFLKSKMSSGPTYVTVTLLMSPSSAIFEGTVLCENGANGCALQGPISRLNTYGRNGDCVLNADLRKFCFCRSKLLKNRSKKF